MSRYYVISPNVENDGNIQDYLEQMFLQKPTRRLLYSRTKEVYNP